MAEPPKPPTKTPAKQVAKKAPAKAAAKAPARKITPPRERKRKTTDVGTPAEPVTRLASVTPIQRPVQTKTRGNNGSQHNPTTPTQLRLLERRQAAATLRASGMNWVEVAHFVRLRFGLDGDDDGNGTGYNRKRAQEDVELLVERVTVQTVDELRQRELLTLDRMQRLLWPKIAEVDLDAYAAMDRIMARRHRITGLEAPTKYALVGENGGPIRLTVESEPHEIYEQVLEHLDAILPHTEMPQLPGAMGPT